MRYDKLDQLLEKCSPHKTIRVWKLFDYEDEDNRLDFIVKIEKIFVISNFAEDEIWCYDSNNNYLKVLSYLDFPLFDTLNELIDWNKEDLRQI